MPQELCDTLGIVNTSGIKTAGFGLTTSEQVRAARALLRWEQQDLARASGVSLPSIKRLERQPGALAAQLRTVQAIREAFEAAGIAFIHPNGGGAGVRLRDPK